MQFFVLALVTLLVQPFLGNGFVVDPKDDCLMVCSYAPNSIKCRSCGPSRKNRLPMRFGKRDRLTMPAGNLQYFGDASTDGEKRSLIPDVVKDTDQQIPSSSSWAYQVMPFETRGRWLVGQSRNYDTAIPMYPQ